MSENNKKDLDDLDIDKVKEIYNNIVEDFPFEKYEKLVEALKEVMSDPRMKKEVKLYFKENPK